MAQQELEQEAADCEAQLLDCLSTATAQPSLLQQLLLLDGGEPSTSDSAAQHDGVPAASAALGEAAALAGEAARLLRSNSPAPAMGSLQQRMASTLAGLQAELASLQAAAGGLLGDIQRAQRQAASRNSEESSLQERLTQLCASHPLAPAVCAAHLHAEAAELEEKHAQQRQERRAARRAFLASSAGRRQMGGSAATEVAQPTADEPGLESAEASSARSSSSGDSASWQGPDSLAAATADGWAAEEHAVFLAARSTAGPAGSALVRRLAALLPARSGEQVAAHERWHKEAGRLQVAAQQGEAGAQQAESAFLAAAAALLARAEAQCLEQAAAALQQLEAAAASLQAGSSLQQQREQRAQAACTRPGRAAAMDEVARFEAAAAAAAQQAERRRQELDWRDQMKLLVAQHHEKRAAEAAAAAAASQAAAAAAARESAAAAALGRQRVACRAAQAEAKRGCRAQQEASRQQERERRKAALDALAARVAPAVQRDAARATGPTESSAAAASVEQQRHGLFARALGFTTDQLLADQRFKVRAHHASVPCMRLVWAWGGAERSGMCRRWIARLGWERCRLMESR